MADNWPKETGFISRGAFDEACHALARRSDSRSSDIRLETRREGEHQYLKITRPLSPGIHPSAHSGSTKLFSAAQHPYNVHDPSDVEEEDEDIAIHHSPQSSTVSSVEYHVLRSTSYRVPVLYFFVHNFSPSLLQSVDTVYENLVPKHLQSGVRTLGVMGGIGMTNHPLTDIPCFWVHPCNSAEAMRDILGGVNGEVSPVEYLMLWIGLVGSAVGLTLPKDIISKRESMS